MPKSPLRKLIPLANSLVSTALIQRTFGRFVPVFMLHRLQHDDLGIQGQSADLVRRHLEHFRNQGYNAISLEQLGKMLRDGEPPPLKSAVFTIDDGFIDHHDIAGPLFAEYDIPLTFFMITDFIDRALWPWDDQVSHAVANAVSGHYTYHVDEHALMLTLDDQADRRSAVKAIRDRLKQVDNSDLYAHIDALYACLRVERPGEIPAEHQPMSWDQANRLCSMGHRIAAHTRSHRILSRLNDEEACAEISDSIARVAQMVDDASPVFAYPTGRAEDFTEREFTTLEEQNVLATVSTVAAPYIYNERMDHDIHSIPRYALPDSPVDFMQYLGWIEFMKLRLRRTRH